jgi:hypothetical protein
VQYEIKLLNAELDTLEAEKSAMLEQVSDPEWIASNLGE